MVVRRRPIIRVVYVSRVRLVVYLCQMLEIKMRIHLGCRDIRMTKQLLYATQVMAGLQKVGGERVTK